MRLYRLESLEGDGTVQVSTGVDPDTGDVVILLRVGLMVAALDVDGAGELGAALVQEAVEALGPPTPPPDPVKSTRTGPWTTPSASSSAARVGSASWWTPSHPPAILHHLPEGAHRLIPAPTVLGAIPPPHRRPGPHIGLLAVAIRLRDLADDCDDVLAHAQGVDA